MLRGYGVRTVVDLRWPEELREHPSVFQQRPGDVRYHHVSLLAESEESWRLRTPEVPKERWNRMVLLYAPRELARTLTIMAHAAPGTVLFHCAAGKDRTGLVSSLLLAIAGVPVDSMAEDYARSTDLLREHYLAASPVEEHPKVLDGLSCPREQVYTMMEFVDEHDGGIEGYLRGIGLATPVIALLRERLR
jgi:protein-tyrosine phosphatase